MQQIVVNTTAKSDAFSGDYGNNAAAANSTTQVTDIAGEFCITDNEKGDTLQKESQDEYNTGLAQAAVQKRLTKTAEGGKRSQTQHNFYNKKASVLVQEIKKVQEENNSLA